MDIELPFTRMTPMDADQMKSVKIGVNPPEMNLNGL
jgi:hypothetical protein